MTSQLPQILGNSFNLDNVGPQMILEDHSKAMNEKFRNQCFKPWKN